MNISELSVSQLQRGIEIKKQIEKLQKDLAALLGGGAVADGRPRRGMSAAAKARIAAAQKVRWAKYRSGKAKAKPRRKVSSAARKRLSQLAKARWAKAKASGRSAL